VEAHLGAPGWREVVEDRRVETTKGEAASTSALCPRIRRRELLRHAPRGFLIARQKPSVSRLPDRWILGAASGEVAQRDSAELLERQGRVVDRSGRWSGEK